MSSETLDMLRERFMDATKRLIAAAGPQEDNGASDAWCKARNSLIAAERADAVRPWQEQDDAIRATLKRLNPDDKARDIVGSIEQMADAERVQRERADGLEKTATELFDGVCDAGKHTEMVDDATRPYRMALIRYHLDEKCGCPYGCTPGTKREDDRCLMFTDADIDAARKEAK